jgi:ATP-dependent RNA helicase HelY
MSCFVFEPRGDDEFVTKIGGVAGERVRQIERLSASIRDDEKSLGITQHRGLHRGFFDTARDWCSGSSLEDVLSEDLQPGDFVRTMRQIADLLRQLGEVSENEKTRAAAREAAHSVLRGVVLASIGGVEA